MKSRLRRKATENEEEENASSCGSPVSKDKENFSPKSSKSRQSIETQHDQFITLLKDFDQNVAMTKKDIYTNALVIADNTSLPFLQALTKLPSSVKNMKWGDYLNLKSTRQQASSLLPIVVKPDSATIQDTTKLAVPTASLKIETPAIRSSSRLAKKLPAITPKFDPTTPAAPKRLPKPGEVLLSLKGSPVAVPNPTPLMARSISNLAITEEKQDVLAALLSDPETLNNALKDKNTCKAIVKAYNNVKMLQD